MSENGNNGAARTGSTGIKKAMFGAGCFWGVESAFREMPGVIEAPVGYTGGWVVDPTYEHVCSGGTGHAEIVQVEYDPEKVGYDELLEVFWRIHNPTQKNRQGVDVGSQYRTAIFYYDEDQRHRAEASREKAQSGYKKPVVTEITPAPTFYRAEEYHQRYFEKKGIFSCPI